MTPRTPDSDAAQHVDGDTAQSQTGNPEGFGGRATPITQAAPYACDVCDAPGKIVNREIALCPLHDRCGCGQPATDCYTDRGWCGAKACEPVDEWQENRDRYLGPPSRDDDAPDDDERRGR